jgi:predicted  nucleic acid-binding Zn-ribbon protein
VEDQIQRLLKKLLATEDAEEFETLSRELKTALHERIEKLRDEARALKLKAGESDRRKRPRNGKNKP